MGMGMAVGMGMGMQRFESLRVVAVIINFTFRSLPASNFYRHFWPAFNSGRMKECFNQ